MEISFSLSMYSKEHSMLEKRQTWLYRLFLTSPSRTEGGRFDCHRLKNKMAVPGHIFSAQFYLQWLNGMYTYIYMVSITLSVKDQYWHQWQNVSPHAHTGITPPLAPHCTQLPFLQKQGKASQVHCDLPMPSCLLPRQAGSPSHCHSLWGGTSYYHTSQSTTSISPAPSHPNMAPQAQGCASGCGWEQPQPLHQLPCSFPTEQGHQDILQKIENTFFPGMHTFF